MIPTYQSLAGIARMPYPGASTTRTTTTTTTTTTTATTVKPKLTLDNLTNYLAQLEQTPTTPLPNVEEPSSTIAECGEDTTLAGDYNGSDPSSAARGDRIFNGRQKWKNSIKEEEDEDEERGLGVKDADADSGSGSSCSSTPPRLEVPITTIKKATTTPQTMTPQPQPQPHPHPDPLLLLHPKSETTNHHKNESQKREE